MDLSKLEVVSTDALQAIRDKCADVLKKRAGLAIQRGAVAWFLDKEGGKRFMRISRINQRTCSGNEVDPDTHCLKPMTWKVGMGALTPVVDKEVEQRRLSIERQKRDAAQKRAATAAESDKPVADYGSAW